jgi:hypothetical protein
MKPRIGGEMRNRSDGRTPPARLIHIGPHKTGTTTIQSALEHNHVALAKLGVHYLRPRVRATLGVTAAMGAVEPGPVRDARMREWKLLLANAAGAQRIVLSNEFLCEADRAGAEQVVRDLGSDDNHVVVTLRPLAAILPSQWQQFVQSGISATFSGWLEAVLGRESSPTVDLFWRRHQHDELVARWAGVVGASNVTVVVGDSKDREQLPRVFADLLGVPADLLRPAPDAGVMNRSFTRQEVEVVRRFNEQLDALNARRVRRGQPPLELSNDQRLHAWQRVKNRRPRKSESPIVLPDWARGPIEQLSGQMVERIGSVGVNVIGDLQALTALPPAADDKLAEPAMVPTDLAVAVTIRLLAEVMTQHEGE